MICAARWAHTNAPVRLRAITAFQVSSGTSRKGSRRPPPALFTNTSSAAELAGEPGDGLGGRGEVRDVNRDGDRTGAVLAHLACGALGLLAVDQPGDPEVESVLSQRHRRSPVRCPTGAGDDRAPSH